MSSVSLPGAPAVSGSRRHPFWPDPLLLWERDGLDWPHRDASRFLRAGGVDWHVQVLGSGPTLLLLHGTGASSHSFAGLVRHLASDFTLVVPDLPGHGFSRIQGLDVLSLPGMAAALRALVAELDLDPQFLVGHSAGAAVALRMLLDGLDAADGVVSINGALLPFSGLQGRLFSPLARMLAAGGGPARYVATRAGRPAIMRRLIDSTGSCLDDEDLIFYQRLAGNVAHVRATLAMMARWDLPGFQADLLRCHHPVRLLAGSRDRLVPPRQAHAVAARLQRATVHGLTGLGHLAHEEAPRQVADAIHRALKSAAGEGSE